MSIVGKKFPNLSVNAMNEMGDTIQINVLEEAVNNKKKVVLFWYPKTLRMYAQQSCMLFKKLCQNLKRETQL